MFLKGICKNFYICLGFIFLWPFGSVLAYNTVRKVDLPVQIRGVDANKNARICYALFADDKGFPEDISAAVALDCLLIPAVVYAKVGEDFNVASQTKATEENSFSFQIPGVLADRPHCLSVFQDLNGDRALNKSFLGIPQEKFGFSGNPKIRLGAPKFENCHFIIRGNTVQVSGTGAVSYPLLQGILINLIGF